MEFKYSRVYGKGNLTRYNGQCTIGQNKQGLKRKIGHNGKKSLRVFTKGKILILKTSLGRWTDKENKNKWSWYYQESSDSVFKRISNGWQVYRRIRKRRRRGKYPSFQNSCTTKSTLLEAKRCTVKWNKGTLQLTGTAETKEKSIKKLSFSEVFGQGKGYHMMQYMTSTEDTVNEVILPLRQGTVKMVTVILI